VTFGAAKILGGIHIEEPAGCGQAVRMGDLAALNEGLDGDNADWLAEAFGGCAESGETAAAAGLQFLFEGRQDRTVEHRRKGLGKSVDGWDGYRIAGDKSVVQEIYDQASRQERQVYW